MIDPENARAVLREYHSTASDRQIVDDLRRHSPQLARRLGVEAAPEAVMLDSETAGRLLQEHFDTVTPEEFVTRVKRVSPDLAQELWGDRTVEEICADRPRPVRRAAGFFTSLRRSILRLFS